MRGSIRALGVVVSLAAWLATGGRAAAQALTTAFTCQGELASGGLPAAGLYDMQFRLYDALSGGSQVGATLCSNNVSVVGGRFTAILDFGAQFAGQQRFLEIDVRADTGSDCAVVTGYTTLAPRQGLTAVPNSLFALSATAATTASNATQLNGQAPAFYQNAANLSAGTIADARLGGAYSAVLSLANAGNTFTGTFTGAGTGLTGLNAANLSSGTLADQRLSGNVALLNAGQTFSVLQIFGAGLEIPTGAVAGRVLTSDVLGKGTWQVPAPLALNYNGSGNSTVDPVFAISNLATNVEAIGIQGFSYAGRGVYGVGQNPTGFNKGVWGQTMSNAGTGVYGIAVTPTGANFGVYGETSSTTGIGTFGYATKPTGTTRGVVGLSVSSSGVGVDGEASSSSGITKGVYGQSSSSTGYGVHGANVATSGDSYGVYGTSGSDTGVGVYGQASAGSGFNYGVYGRTNSPSGYGVYGQAPHGPAIFGFATASDGTGIYGTGGAVGVSGESNLSSGKGVFGQSSSTDGYGVYGVASAGTGPATGVYGSTSSTQGVGIYGFASAASGPAVGMSGESDSTSGTGVVGYALAGSGTTYGISGLNYSTGGIGVNGLAVAATGLAYGVKGQTTSSTFNAAGVRGEATSTGQVIGVEGVALAGSLGTGLVGRGSATGVYGEGAGNGVVGMGTSVGGNGVSGVGGPLFGDGIRGDTSAGGSGVHGVTASDAGFSTPIGVFGEATGMGDVVGVEGLATTVGSNGTGVVGRGSSIGVSGYGWTGGYFTSSGNSLLTSGSAAIYARGGPLDGLAGWFVGEVFVDGRLQVHGDTLVTGNKSFRIDHPLDPENKYLLHYCAEGPEPYNVYTDTITTDEKGEAWVQLPDYFEAINKNPRYQLTVVEDGAGPGFVQVKIAQKIRGNRFMIMTSLPNTEVCWEVKAVRNDLWNQKHGHPAEVEKPERARGKYQVPELYDKPKEMGESYRPEPAAVSAAPAR